MSDYGEMSEKVLRFIAYLIPLMIGYSIGYKRGWQEGIEDLVERFFERHAKATDEMLKEDNNE